MARSVRLEYAGAVYHVMCRGDRRENIFLADKDRWVFLDTLAEACERSGMRVHAYVLMSNHYHLLLETPEGNLVAGMRWLQGTYTARFNARHRYGGHLFQGRYKAIPIDAGNPEYFRTLSDYIHLNPARAKLLDAKRPRLGDYPWSSYRFFVGARPLPPWLVRARVFGAMDLADEGAGSRRRFAAHLARKVREAYGEEETGEQAAEWQRLRRGWYVGGEAFRDRLLAMAGAVVGRNRRTSYVTDGGVRRHDEAEAQRLLKRIEAGLEVKDWQVLAQNDPRKQAAAWWLRRRTVVGGVWIAAALGMGHVSNVSRAYLAMQRAGHPAHEKLKKEVMRICKD